MPDHLSIDECKAIQSKIAPYDVCVWAADGDWECAALGSVQSAEGRTRAQAVQRYVHESGEDWVDVGCWKRWIWIYTRQDAWDEYGKERWWNDHLLDNHIEQKLVDAETMESRFVKAGTDEEVPRPPDPPDSPPEWWQPSEWEPRWEFVHKSHPRAQEVWVCGPRRNGAPVNPAGEE